MGIIDRVNLYILWGEMEENKGKEFGNLEFFLRYIYSDLNKCFIF